MTLPLMRSATPHMTRLANPPGSSAPRGSHCFSPTMKTTTLRRSLLATAIALLATASLARAHSVWLEDTPDQQLVIRFGEPGDEFERSPGHLDSLSLPLAWKSSSVSAKKPISFAVEKKSDHFLLAAATPADAACGETRFPVMKRGSRPASWPHFYVRWQPAGAPGPAAPALTLDLLPTATPGEFRLCLRGQPLPNANVTVRHFGNNTEETVTTDATGIAHFTTATRGLVLLTANHKESLPGFDAGVAYDVTSHNVALTWRQP